MKARRSLWSAPLAAQVVALVIVAVLAAQIVNLAVVLTSPPPERPVFRIGEVAELLAGGGTEQLRSRYELKIAAGPPHDNRVDPEERQAQLALARSLSADPVAVRVVMRGGEGVPGGQPPKGRAMPPWGPKAGPPEDRAAVAALRLADGRWRVVRARPSGWIEPWQGRALLWFLVTALVVCPLGYTFARRLTAPIRRFAEAADRLGRDPRAPPLELEGPAEIVVAGAAFNGMQERLRRYVEDRTAMVAAIAHDLRTPLTRLAFRLESAPDQLREEGARDIAEMQAMIGATLEFVRDTAAAAPRSALDFSALVESVADDLRVIGRDMRVEPSDRLVLNGDPGGLRRMVANLFTNAAQYGGRAVGRVHRVGDQVVLEIADDGPGLPEAELARVFEPFYRAEASRSRETGGIGLGLAVARTVAHAHGGTVDLSNRPEGGLLARVVLPL